MFKLKIKELEIKDLNVFTYIFILKITFINLFLCILCGNISRKKLLKS